jgi:hypothetical protein
MYDGNKKWITQFLGDPFYYFDGNRVELRGVEAVVIFTDCETKDRI